MNKPTTLREEFHKFSLFMANAVEAGDASYKDIEQAICDWWLDKFSAHSTELLSKIEGMKKPADETNQKQSARDFNIEVGFNQALDQVISLINQEK